MWYTVAENDETRRNAMRTYDYLLFDLDGTLTLSHYGIYASVRYALEKLRRPEPTEAQLRKVVGPPLQWSFEHTFSLSEREAEEAVRLYRERYEAGGMYENKPFPYALTLLKNVKAAGYKTALATAKPKTFADRICEKFGLLDYFDVAAVATLDKKSDKTFVVGECMRRLNAEKDKCLMIGDRADDVLGARANGVETAAVRCGYAEEGELERANPRYLFDDLQAVEKYLLK